MELGKGMQYIENLSNIDLQFQGTYVIRKEMFKYITSNIKDCHSLWDLPIRMPSIMTERIKQI